MFCPNCGNNISDDAKFCNKCGWKKTREIKKLLNYKMIFACIAIIVLLLVLLFRLFQPSGKGKVYSIDEAWKADTISSYWEPGFQKIKIDDIDTVKFGSYMKNVNYNQILSIISSNRSEPIFWDDNTRKKYKCEPIEWFVSSKDKENGKILLVSKYILEYMPFNDNINNISWDNSYLKRWLNNDFLTIAFNDNEKSYLVDSSNSNYIILDWEVGHYTKDKNLNASIDKVFVEEYKHGPDISKLEEKYYRNVSNYVKTKMKSIDNNTSVFNEWSRTCADNVYFGEGESNTTTRGVMMRRGWAEATSNCGVRPMIWVKVNANGVDSNTYSGNSNNSSSGGSISNDVSNNSSSSNEPINRKTATSQVDTKKSYKEIKNINSSEKYSQETSIEKMDTVSFGTYENNGSKEGIEWIVLEKNDSEAILLSKYILDCQQYNSVKQNMTWEESGIRKWLNGTFFTTAFSSDEQNRILDSYIENNDNEKAWTKGGNPTVDKVYLLSIDECIKYFGEPNATNQIVKLSTYGTAYAKNKGLYIDSDASAWHNGYSPFWLRSPGVQQSRAGVVNYCGYFYSDGNSVDFKLNGVRPVIKIKLK